MQQEQPREFIGDPPRDTNPQPMQTAPSREDIERRAYDLYMQRGGGDGGDLDDWLAAERQLRVE